MEMFLFTKALASAIFDIAFAGACGALLAYLWLDPQIHDDVTRRLRFALMVCASAMALFLPGQLWLLTATMLGTSAPSEIKGQLIDVLTTTHAGKLLIPDFVIALLLLALSRMQLLMRRRRGVYLCLALFAVLAVFRSGTGHAATDGDFTIREVVQLLHLSAIAVWGGGVMIAGFLVLPSLLLFENVEAISDFGRRLSRAATVSVVLVLFSGLYNAWRGSDSSLRLLLHSQWGGILLGKSLLVLLALALGAMNRQLIKRPGAMYLADAARLTARIRLEALVMLAVLTITGWLANSPPPDSQY
jgi:copper resistance protein D